MVMVVMVGGGGDGGGDGQQGMTNKVLRQVNKFRMVDAQATQEA